MGCCLSKTNGSCPPSSPPVKSPNLPTQLKTELKKLEEDEQGEKLGLEDKELLGTQDSKSPNPILSSDSDGLLRPTTNSSDPATKNPESVFKDGALVRISNCSKEEVDAILIQCGRLSRTSSECRGGSAGRRYSGSKRSHDFDRESNASIVELNCDDADDERQPSGSHRRRTPSRSRVSRSPARRSRSPITRSSNGGNVKRVLTKRNLGEGLAASRAAAASPRSRSPAMSSGVNGVNSSRKAEFTPHRRTPLTGIDMNSLPFNPLASKFESLKDLQKSKEIDEQGVLKPPASVVSQNNQLDADASNDEGFISEMSAEQLKDEVDDDGEQSELPPISTRGRSSLRSRDLDVRVEASSDPNPAASYNSLILEDIRNFHRKTSSNKNCSVVESVPDLNSCTSKNPNTESEVNAGDGLVLMEPSIHKYITVRKRSPPGLGGDLDELESSGSNSFVAGDKNRGISSSSWEPNSADSSDCWTSSRSREDGLLPVSFERLTCRDHDDSPRNL